jgi:hypothetical protein
MSDSEELDNFDDGTRKSFVLASQINEGDIENMDRAVCQILPIPWMF